MTIKRGNSGKSKEARKPTTVSMLCGLEVLTTTNPASFAYPSSAPRSFASGSRSIPKKAMTNAKSGSSVTPNSCDNDIAEQFRFGRKIGVNGTPNIVLSDGSIIPGYQPPKQLEQALKALL